ncbi:MAG: hypothetical protein KatS3mg102_0518 [Planctomycetota bacterium]|nr:MAG: hypothetical protein KatS3mg102_0518 [Planctomycetota bacterium]
MRIGFAGALAAALLVAGCGGDGGGDAIRGLVIDGPVTDGKVNTSRLDAFGAFESFVGTSRTAADGSFRQRVPGRGFYLLEVVSGRFTDLASGATVDLAARGLALRAIAEGPGEVVISPLTTLAAGLVECRLAAGDTVAEAVAAAVDGLGALFEAGGVHFDVLRTRPADLGDPADPFFGAGITPETLHAAVLEGLSHLAQARDLLDGGNGRITPLEVAVALAQDARDCAIDGVDATQSPPARVLLGQTAVPLVLGGSTFFQDLAAGILAGSAPGLSGPDRQAIAAAIDPRGAQPSIHPAAPAITAVSSAFGGSPPRVHARGGDALTITGSGFGTSPVVFVGGVQATVTSATASAIEVVVNAAGPGLGDLVVDNGAATAALVDAVRLVGDAAGTIALVPAASSVVAGSGTLAFSAAGLVDSLGETVLDGDAFDVTISFTPAAGAAAAAALPSAIPSTVTSTGGAIAFDVEVGQTAGTFLVQVAANPGTASGQASVTVTPDVPASITIETGGVVQLVADGLSTASITGEVRDAFGNAVADGTPVTLATNLGSVSSPSSTTTGSYGPETYTAATSTGTATITATAGSASTATAITLIPDAPAQIVGLAITASTLSPDGSTAPSSGVLSGQVLDAHGNPVQSGVAVDIVVDPASRLLAQPAQPLTDASGVFTSTIGALGPAGPGTVTAQVNAVPGVQDSLGVTVIAGAVSTVSLAATPSSGLIAGVSTVTLTGQVLDAFGNPRASEPVALTTTAGFFPPGGSTTHTVFTNAAGQYVATLNAPAAVTTAVVTAEAGGVQATPLSLDFRAGAPATVVVAPDVAVLTANGVSSTAVLVTVRDAFNNPVEDGTPLTFELVQGQSAENGTLSASSGTTSGGTASFVYTAGTKVQTVTLRAIAGAVSGTASVDLVPGPLAQLSLAADPQATSVDAALVAAVQYKLTATGLDAFGNLVADGTLIAFSLDPAAGGFDFTPAGTSTPTSTASTTAGIVVMELRGVTRTGTFGATASDPVPGDGTAPPATVALSFDPGAPSQIVGLAVSPDPVVVSRTALVSGTVLDTFGNTVADGTQVQLAIVSGNGSFAPNPASTTGGVFTSTLTAGPIAFTTSGGPEAVSASAGPGVASTTAVTFNPDVPAGFALAAASGPSADPARALADGSCQVLIVSTDTIRDAFNNPVLDTETFTVSGSGFTVAAAPLLSAPPASELSFTIQAGTSPGSFVIEVRSDSNPAAVATLDLVLEEALFAAGDRTGVALTTPVFAVGDVDGDGDDDIAEVSGDPGSGVIAVSFNGGTGTFATSSTTTAVSGALAVALGDFDRDGDLDLVVARNEASGLFDLYLFDSSAGTYASPPAAEGIGPASVAAPYVDLAVADCDDDGLLDVLAASGDAVHVWRTTSLAPLDFTLAAQVDFDGAVRRVLLADVALDGLPDLVVLTESGLEVALNDHVGGFLPPDLVVPFAGGHDLALGDIDRDGDLDAVVARGSGAGAEIAVLRNTRFAGSARFTSSPSPRLVPSFSIEQFERVLVLDANTDGRPDIAATFRLTDVAGDTHAHVALFAQSTGVGVAFEPMVADLGTELEEGLGLAAGDFDRNGRPDLAAVFTGLCLGASEPSANPGNTRVLRNLAPLRPLLFGTSLLSFDLSPAPTDFRDVVAGDFRRDGGPDLVVLHGGDEVITLDFDKGRAVTGDVETSPVNDFDGTFGGELAELQRGDFDRDGKLDLVYDDTEDPDGVTSLFATGPLGGVFQPPGVQVSQFSLDAFVPLLSDFAVVGDFRPGDGLDLVVSDRTGGAASPARLALAPNDGAGGFVAVDVGDRIDLDGIGDPLRGVSGRFDADANPDLAYLSRTQDRVVFFFGNPNLNSGFDPTPRIMTATAIFSAIAKGDFDRDGIEDVIVVAPGQAAIITPKPGLTVALPVLFVTTLGNEPTAVAVADFNRDGALDFAVASTGGLGLNSFVEIYLGDGAGGFSLLGGAPVELGNEDPVLQLVADDLDGDGRADLAALQNERLIVLFAD